MTSGAVGRSVRIRPRMDEKGGATGLLRGGRLRLGGGGRRGLGDAEGRLAVLALDQLAADVVRHGEKLAAAKIGTDELDGHIERLHLRYRMLRPGA